MVNIVTQCSGRADGGLSRGYVLALLALVYCFNALDRSIMAILIEPLKVDLALSDSQAGLMSGLAFALCNAIAAIPLGMAADRFNRRNLIALCLGFWSAMTALGGFARNFVELLITRILVGVGEAGSGPASMSMIADLFPRRSRATAIAILCVAAPIGAMTALAGGGWMAAHYGWRTTLLAAGLPGAIMAFVLFATVREPVRGASEATVDRAPPPSLREVFHVIRGSSSLRHLLAGMALTTAVISAMGMWTPTFFLRSHGFSIQQAGTLLALTQATSIVSIFLSGAIADRLARRDERWWLWVVALGALLTAPSIAAMLLVESATVALIFNALYMLLSMTWFGPCFATLQSLAPLRMRATIAAIAYFLNNVIGFGLGVQIVGILSDQLAFAGAHALGFALFITAAISLWAATHYYLAAKTLREQLAQAAASSRADAPREPVDSQTALVKV